MAWRLVDEGGQDEGPLEVDDLIDAAVPGGVVVRAQPGDPAAVDHHGLGMGMLRGRHPSPTVQSRGHWRSGVEAEAGSIQGAQKEVAAPLVMIGGVDRAAGEFDADGRHRLRWEGQRQPPHHRGPGAPGVQSLKRIAVSGVRS